MLHHKAIAAILWIVVKVKFYDYMQTLHGKQNCE